MSQTVIGIFDNASEAQDAVEQLVKRGFDRSNIDVSANTSGTSGTTSGNVTGLGTTSSNTSTFGDTTSSAASALEQGESKVGKFFKSLFGGDDDTSSTSGYSNYERVAERGTVVTVHAKTSEEAETAADLLDDYGAVNVDEQSAKYGSTGTNTASSLNLDQTKTTGSAIPIIEEKLQVGKRTVETGGVRLRSRIVERPVEESLRLREERVYVDRTPVNRLVTGTELESFKEGTIELTETAEVPVVAKEAYVKEEVSIGKDVSEREETVRDTVRSTEVDVENIKGENITTSSKSSNTSGTGNTSGTSNTF